MNSIDLSKMLMKRFIFLICVTLLHLNTISAQQQKEIARFYVTHASHNGNDITEWAVNRKVFTVFYTINDEPYMANVSDVDDDQSWGKVYKVDIFYFNWNYSNSYDSKKGTCKVQFLKIYKPQGIVSKLKLITEALDVTEYIGYMEGSIDFSNY